MPSTVSHETQRNFELMITRDAIKAHEDDAAHKDEPGHNGTTCLLCRLETMLRTRLAKLEAGNVVNLPTTDAELDKPSYGNGSGTGHKTYSDDASDKQRAFLRSLVNERFTDDALAQWLDKINGRLSKSAASGMIKLMLDTPKLVKAPTSTVARESSVSLTDGFYRVEGTFYKVQLNQAGTRLYAKVWDVDRWEYAPGGMKGLKPEHKITEQDAAEFGALYGRCMKCRHRLTDEYSIAHGYGKVCASRLGIA